MSEKKRNINFHNCFILKFKKNTDNEGNEQHPFYESNGKHQFFVANKNYFNLCCQQLRLTVDRLNFLKMREAVVCD